MQLTATVVGEAEPASSTLTKASLPSEACEALRGLLTRSLVVTMERLVKLELRKLLRTCREEA